jgi:maleamate amidohydrolase
MCGAGSRVTLSVAIAALFMMSGCEGRPTKAQGENTALMLIGYQADYLLASGRLPVAQDQVAAMIQATNVIVDAARKNAVGVFYIRDEASPFHFLSNHYRNQATPRLWDGSQFDQRANVFAGPDFTKERRDAFTNSTLAPWLNEQNVGRLVVGGAYVERSVLATVKTALKLGYKVTVVSDAVAGASDDWRDQALKGLKDAGATIETSQQVASELKPNPTLGLSGPLTGAWWLFKDEKPPASQEYLGRPGQLEPPKY